MDWIILIVAGFFESGFAFCLGKMKETSGTEYWLWGAGFLVCLALSMVLLARAVRTLPIGTAYPVWTGIGAVGTVLFGIFFLHEPATLARLFFIALLVFALIGLKMAKTSLVFPVGAVLAVFDADACGGQSVADAVGCGPVFRRTGFQPFIE